MKINEKDRGQLLRMAGNIACGFIERYGDTGMDQTAVLSARLAVLTMQAVDAEIEQANKEG